MLGNSRERKGYDQDKSWVVTGGWRKKTRAPGPIRFRTTFRNCILDTLKRRGWKEVEDDSECDLNWMDRDWIRERFDKVHLEPYQKVNHFRNHYELTRKDTMVKNLKRYKRQLEKDGKMEEAAQFNFFPLTFVLPGEYLLYVEAFKKIGGTWIMKPVGKSQGKGIFLVDKLSQTVQWKSDYRLNNQEQQAESYVAQQYIDSPLLIGGRKFDIRLYVLVKSYNPLVVYMYRDGFARFSVARYEKKNINNTFVHVTNVAVQKTAADYDADTGSFFHSFARLCSVGCVSPMMS
uniref:Tubulin--tyrosine ligase-like protein 9 n=1 Tax=Lotharella globosa TaxID=91324 RepID=A0A7S4DS96_9EUKA